MTFMHMIFRALPAIILVFLIWPLTLGATLGIKKNLDRYIIGFATVQALFFIVYIPAICFAWSSRALTYTAAIIITLFGVGGTLFRYHHTRSRKEFLALTKPNLAYLKNPFLLVAIGIVLYEMWIYAAKEPWIYGDDVAYLKTITRIVDTNSIYTKSWVGQFEPAPLNTISFKAVFTSYYPFLGMISILSGLHPLILCKTVIPLIYLPTHYLVVWRICMFLFGDEENSLGTIEKRSLFMFFYAILIEFGHISYYTLSRRVTIWIYNSKSDCFCLLLIPLFFYTYLLLLEKTDRLIVSNRLWYRFLVVLIIAIACNSSSLMGVIMSPLVMGIWYVIASVKKKNIRIVLYGLVTFIPHIITAILIVSFLR